MFVSKKRGRNRRGKPPARKKGNPEGEKDPVK